MTLPPYHIPPFVPGDRNVDRVVPFSFEDGETYLRKLERMGAYLNELRDSLDGVVEGNNDWIIEQLEDIIVTVNDALASQAGNIQDVLDDVSARVDVWMQSTFEANDSVVSELFSRVDSQTRQAIDARLTNAATDATNVSMFGPSFVNRCASPNGESGIGGVSVSPGTTVSIVDRSADIPSISRSVYAVVPADVSLTGVNPASWTSVNGERFAVIGCFAACTPGVDRLSVRHLFKKGSTYIYGDSVKCSITDPNFIYFVVPIPTGVTFVTTQLLYRGTADSKIYFGDVTVATYNDIEMAEAHAAIGYKDGNSVGWKWDGVPNKSTSRSMILAESIESEPIEDASETVKGIAKAATASETILESSRSTFVTPFSLGAWWDTVNAVETPRDVHAVFIGASNVAPGTWPENLCNEMGWVPHNYANGAAGGVRGGLWLGQVNSARDDASFDNNDVGFVIIAGGGNDVRAGVTDSEMVNSLTVLVHGAQSSFPNARVIVVPCLWNIGGAHANLSTVYNAMYNTCRAVRAEFVPEAWTWLMGLDSSYMADAVHPSPKGYAVFVSMLVAYLNGDGNTRVYRNGGASIASGFAAHSRGGVKCVCVDGVVHFEARVTKTGGNFAFEDVPITLPDWAAISTDGNSRPLIGGLGAQAAPVGLYIIGNTVSVRNTSITSDQLNIPAQSWLIGQ